MELFAIVCGAIAYLGAVLVMLRVEYIKEHDRVLKANEGVDQYNSAMLAKYGSRLFNNIKNHIEEHHALGFFKALFWPITLLVRVVVLGIRNLVKVFKSIIMQETPYERTLRLKSEQAAWDKKQQKIQAETKRLEREVLEDAG